MLLQELSLQRCHRVSDEAVAAVALKGTLRQLNVNSLPLVGISTVKALATAGRWVSYATYQYGSTFKAASLNAEQVWSSA